MSNPIILPNNFGSYDFIKMSKKEKNPKNKIRLIAMAHIKAGKTLQEISQMLIVHWKTIQTWLRNFRNSGINGLYLKVKRIKPNKLSKQAEQWVIGFLTMLGSCETGGFITGKQLQSIIKKEFSVTCCLQTIYNTLHRLRFSWITSRSKHPKSDSDIQELYTKFSTAAQGFVTT